MDPNPLLTLWERGINPIPHLHKNFETLGVNVIIRFNPIPHGGEPKFKVQNLFKLKTFDLSLVKSGMS